MTNVTESSVSDAKSSRSQKKKQRMKLDAESVNAQKQTCLGTDSLREDADLGPEQSSGSRGKKKRKGSSSNTEKQSEGVRTPESPLDEQSALSETKRKNKMAKSGVLENLNAISEKSLIDVEKVSDSHLVSKMSVSLESGLKKKKKGGSSGLGILENCSLESAHSETKQNRKKKKKVGIFGEFGNLNGKSILELNDKEGNSLIDQKKASDSHLESKINVGLRSELAGAQLNEYSERKKKGKGKKTRLSCTDNDDISSKSNGKDNNEAENNNICPEPINENDLMVSLITDKQSDSPVTASIGMVKTQNSHVDGDRETLEIGKKEKTHHKKRKKSSNLLGDGLEHIQTSVDHLEKEHTTSSENGSIEVPVRQTMPVQVLEVELGNSTCTESDLKERKRKKRKNSKGSLCKDEDQKDVEIETNEEEVVPFNLTVAKDDVALTAKVSEVALGNSTGTESDLKGSKRKKQKGSLCKDEYQKDVEIETKMEEVIPSPLDLAVTTDDVTLIAKVSEVALGESTGTESDPKGRKRKKSKKLCKDGDQTDVEIGTKMEEVIPSPLNLAVAKDHDTLTANVSPSNLAVTTDDVTLIAKVSEVALGKSTGTETDPKGRKRKKSKKLCKDGDQTDVEIGTKMEEFIPSPLNLAVAKDHDTLTANVSPSNLAVGKDDATLTAKARENNFSRMLDISFQRNCISRPKKKLLVLDLNGILVDVVQIPCKIKPHARVNGKGVFRRPFYDDFLNFCFRTFSVGIWSSRVHKNVLGVLDLLMDKKRRRELVFCYGRNLCTITKFKTLENEDKPLVLKELRKLWDRQLPNLPWKKGEYDESNTLLLDDSPYKALRNPANTAIFPYPYQYTDAADCSLAPEGDLRKYLERLAEAENVQQFIEQNPFGQLAITETDPHWDFYSQIIEDKTLQAR